MARTTTSSFYDWLTGMTRALGYSKDAELARALDVDQSIVSRWRRGSRPSIEHLARVSMLTRTQLEPLLVLAGYVDPDVVRNAEVPEAPSTVDAGERMIREAPIEDFQRAPYLKYWKQRREEEHGRLAKLLVAATLLSDDDGTSSAVLAKAGKSELSAHIVGLYKGLAEAHREQASRYRHMADERMRAVAELSDWLLEKATVVISRLEAAGASKEDIAELTQAVEEATDGPWRRDGDGGEEEGPQAQDAREP